MIFYGLLIYEANELLPPLQEIICIGWYTEAFHSGAPELVANLADEDKVMAGKYEFQELYDKGTGDLIDLS